MERWTPKLKQEQCLPGFTLRMWTDKDGEYVLYTDHIAETRKLIDTYDLLISQEDKKIAELEAENKRLREALDLVISFIPDGWGMPLGWSDLVAQVRGKDEPL